MVKKLKKYRWKKDKKWLQALQSGGLAEVRSEKIEIREMEVFPSRNQRG